MKHRFVSCLFLICAMAYAQAQPRYEEVDLGDGRKYLIGVLSKEQLREAPYKGWFEAGYNAYQPNPALIKNLKPLLQEVHILIFLGTWCGDSRREVPRFLKILDKAGFPATRTKLVGVDRRRDRYKKSPGDEQWGLHIRRVPTFILLKDGKEIGRIVERPTLSLEQDLCDMLSCSPSLPMRE